MPLATVPSYWPRTELISETMTPDDSGDFLYWLWYVHLQTNFGSTRQISRTLTLEHAATPEDLFIFHNRPGSTSYRAGRQQQRRRFYIADFLRLSRQTRGPPSTREVKVDAADAAPTSSTVRTTQGFTDLAISCYYR